MSTSLLRDIKSSTDAPRLTLGSATIATLAGGWLALDLTYVGLYHTVGLQRVVDFEGVDILESIRFAPTFGFRWIVEQISSLLSAAIDLLNYGILFVGGSTLNNFRGMYGLLAKVVDLSTLEDRLSAALRLPETAITAILAPFMTLRFPVVYYAGLALLLHTALLHFRSKEDEQIMRLVELLTESPRNANPEGPNPDLDLDPVEDVMDNTPLNPYGLIFNIAAARSVAGLGLTRVGNVFAYVRGLIRGIWIIGRPLNFLTGPVLLLAESIVQVVAYFVAPAMLRIRLFDATIVRRRLQRPRFLTQLTPTTVSLGSALEYIAYGSHYYEVRKLALLDLNVLNATLSRPQTDALWPVVHVRHDRHAPMLLTQFLHNYIDTTPRYGQRFLFFRFEETICLDPTGPQFLVFPALDLSGSGSKKDPFKKAWKTIRPRYAKVTVRINAIVSPEQTFWIWSSPLIVVASRLQRLADRLTLPQNNLGRYWTVDDANLVIGSLVKFQTELLASRTPQLDARAGFITAGLTMRAVLWRNREADAFNLVRIESYAQLVDRMRAWNQRIYNERPIDLTRDRTTFNHILQVREPTSFYPVQLDLQQLTFSPLTADREQRPHSIKLTVEWIVVDYLCRLADVFSWIILVNNVGLFDLLTDLGRFTPLRDYVIPLADHVPFRFVQTEERTEFVAIRTPLFDTVHDGQPPQ